MTGRLVPSYEISGNTFSVVVKTLNVKGLPIQCLQILTAARYVIE